MCRISARLASVSNTRARFILAPVGELFSSQKRLFQIQNSPDHLQVFRTLVIVLLMNGAAITSSTMAPANTNSGEEQTIVRSGASIRYTNLTAFGRVEIGLNALVVPGDSIALYGVNHNHVNGPQIVDRTFAIGDAATCGGRNIDFIGTIVSIGEKTVTVRESATGTRRFSIGDFARLNQTFDLAKAEARNAAWMD